MSTVISLKLTPTDVLMFRDSRPFDQVATGTESVFPSPRTVAGAVRSWLLQGSGVDLAKLAATQRDTGSEKPTRVVLDAICPENAKWVLDMHIRGPFFMRDGDTLFAQPAHWVKLRRGVNVKKNDLFRLAPARDSLPGYQPPDSVSPGFKHLWAPPDKQDWEEYPFVLRSKSDMNDLLGGKTEFRVGKDEKERLSPWKTERRFGITLDGTTRQVEQGALYASEYLRFRDKDSLRVDLSSSGIDLADLVSKLAISAPCLRLGGEGKMARVEVLTEVDALPSARLPFSGCERFLTALITPGAFANGSWFPKEMSEKFNLISAMVPRPLVYSGWDVAANRPLPTRYAAPAGAVYFWERKDGRDYPDPHGLSISDGEDDRQAGWGLCLRGEWDYVE